MISLMEYNTAYENPARASILTKACSKKISIAITNMSE
jgi:hypothetical protein